MKLTIKPKEPKMQRDELVERLEAAAVGESGLASNVSNALLRQAAKELTRLRVQVPEWQVERETLLAEIARLRQVVCGGKGPLPTGACAWLDMGRGECELVFNKRSDSNRTKKKAIMALFDGVPLGYHPLYLHPPLSAAPTPSQAGEVDCG